MRKSRKAYLLTNVAMSPQQQPIMGMAILLYRVYVKKYPLLL